MKLSALLRRLLGVLVIVCVGVGPLAANAAAPAPVAMASMDAMHDGMPCCPDEAPAPPDCLKLCLLLAACMTTFAPGAPAALMTDAHRTAAFALARPGDDASRPGSAAGPPARPPRS